MLGINWMFYYTGVGLYDVMTCLIKSENWYRRLFIAKDVLHPREMENLLNGFITCYTNNNKQLIHNRLK